LGTNFGRSRFGSRLTRRLRGSTLVACAAQSTTPATAPGPPPAIAAPAPVNPDQDFLNRAMTGTGAQVELGRLAQQQGAAPAVRAFGSQIAAEHARMHARLTSASQRLGMVPNAAAPDLSGLTALSGPEFDRQFIADQVKNQREALGLFESEAQAGQTPRLRAVARESLPTLRRDLRRTEELAARLGA
jgi:putative membrane protein